jgi:cell wall-associated NlpC family hydrolase
MSNPRPRWLTFARCVASVSLVVFGSSAVIAAPSDTDPLAAAAVAVAPGDEAVSRFLGEKGLISNTTAPARVFVNEVRSKASDMVVTAMNFIGVRYQRGGNSADGGFDCSGFTRQVFETSLGLVLPRRADEQAKASGLLAVKRDELQPGDLVFFNTLRRTFSHVGIYVGDGKFIHSPRPGGEVRVEDMRFVYWAKRFTGGRRAEPVVEQAAAGAKSSAPSLPSVLAPLPTLR